MCGTRTSLVTYELELVRLCPHSHYVLSAHCPPEWSAGGGGAPMRNESRLQPEDLALLDILCNDPSVAPSAIAELGRLAPARLDIACTG